MATHSSTVTEWEEAGSTVFTPLLSQFICTHCSRSFFDTHFAFAVWTTTHRFYSCSIDSSSVGRRKMNRMLTGKLSYLWCWHLMVYFTYSWAFCSSASCCIFVLLYLNDMEIFLCKVDISCRIVSLGAVLYANTCSATRQLVSAISSSELCSVSSQRCQWKKNISSFYISISSIYINWPSLIQYFKMILAKKQQSHESCLRCPF